MASFSFLSNRKYQFFWIKFSIIVKYENNFFNKSTKKSSKNASSNITVKFFLLISFRFFGHFNPKNQCYVNFEYCAVNILARQRRVQEKHVYFAPI